MSKQQIPMFQSLVTRMENLGDRIRAARLRRNITLADMAERVGVSRDTLGKLEGGDPAVSFGNYMRVLKVLGMDVDIDVVASNDKLGQRLEEAGIGQTQRKRARP